MSDFIAQIKILGDILVLWAKKMFMKMQRKPNFWVLGNIFPSAHVVKYVFRRYETSSGQYLGLINLL